jgi:cell wall-associated NlpC family hydrolase
MVKRVELGRSRPSGETPAQRDPRLRHRGRRLPAPALGALTALMVVAAGWPGVASAAAIHGRTPAPAPAASPAPSAQPWLLGRTAPTLVPAPGAPAISTAAYVAPLRHVLPVDVVAVSATTLPAAAVRKVRGLSHVRAVEAVDAARIRVNGRLAAVLGVNPSSFRRFAAKPTAKDTKFWRSVEGGGLGLSYEMGKQDKLPAGTLVTVAGRTVQTMQVGRFGTIGIGGVDAVITDQAARSLGFPVRNALVISAPGADFAKLTREIKKALPRSAVVDQMVVETSQGAATAAASATAGSVQPTTSGLASAGVIRAMLAAAESRLGMPYLWGSAGPGSFDCSGLVQWSFRQAGVIMPRVAADQARTGPAVPVNRLQPGDLLFYHTDPTAPDYISHVAIYLGGGKMIQAPEPGMNVEIVSVDLGSGFAGAVDVSPAVAAQVAATSV